MKHIKVTLTAFLMALAITAFTGCDGDVGDHLEDAGDSISDAAESAGDNAQDAVEDAGDSVGDAFEEAGDNIKDATN